MQLFYHKDPTGNFGDDLNEWFWDKALPGFREWSSDTYLIGIGTLINRKRLANFRDKNVVIVGAGVGYGGGPPDQPLPPNWRIYAVRGPESARALGIKKSLGIVDPAAILPSFPEFNGLRTEGLPLFIPHHKSVNRHVWRPACDNVGLSFISPSENAKTVIRRIASAPYVITEAMHGAIIADAFRVPWIPIRIGTQFNDFKWQDWLQSLSISASPNPLFPRIDQIARNLELPRGKRLQMSFRRTIEKAFLKSSLSRCMQLQKQLSNQKVLEAKQTAFRAVLGQLKADFETQCHRNRTQSVT